MLGKLVRWSLGELEEVTEPLQDGLLLHLVGVTACLGMFGGLTMRINNDLLLRGAWRSGMHGGIPLAMVLLWWLWRQRQAGHHDGLATLAATAGGVLVAIPSVARVMGNSSVGTLKTVSDFVVIGVLVGFALLYGAAVRSKMRLGDFGLGLGDWRWWLPRSGIAFVGIWLGAVVVMHTFPDIAAFYPRARSAQESVAGLMEAQVGIVIDIFGWELLFRGLLLWVFARRGDVRGAIEAQAIIFFLAHIDKPTSEMFMSLPGGILAGWFAWRSGSFLPIWVLHSAQLIAVSVIGFWMKMP
jgi:membrane protease YdiL (CAAX protease family)